MNGTLLFGSENQELPPPPPLCEGAQREGPGELPLLPVLPGPETFFKNVYKMPQGHYFKYKDGKMELDPYWIPTFQAEEDKSLEYWVDEN